MSKRTKNDKKQKKSKSNSKSKEQEASGLLSSLGVKTPLSKIPLVSPLLL